MSDARLSNKNDKVTGFTCPVCFLKQKNFFCPNCIRNGDFTHSKTNFLERFADKKLKFIKLKSQQAHISSVVQKHFNNSSLKDDLNLQIRKTEKNISSLGKIIAEKNNILKESKSRLTDNKRRSLNIQKRQMDIKNRIANVRNIVAKQNVTLNDYLRVKTSQENEIQLLLRERLCSLTAYIFKLTEETMTMNNLDDSSENYENSVGSEDTPLLSLSDSSSNSSISRKSKLPLLSIIQYKIVEPWINSNENYAYFSQPNRLEHLDIRENNFRNDGYRITSALSYLCHLTNLIAIYCDIHLPKKLLFSEFYYFKEFKKEDIFSKIAKLNANIIFLCLYHHIEPKLLHPKNSFRNIQLLLNCSSFAGIDNYIEIPNNFYKTVQDNLICDLYLTDKEEFDDSTEGHEEHDYDFVESNIPDLNFSSEQPSGSNLFSLVSSIYRRTTGQS